MPDLPRLLGHRGLRGPGAPPENTVPAFDLALSHGCDGFEFDVRLTADGRAVICHDPKHAGLEISRARLCDLGTICTLESVLARYSRAAFLDIELKVPGLTESLVSEIKNHPPECGYVVSSFLPEVIQDMHQKAAGIALGMICETKEQLELWSKLPVQYVISTHSLMSLKLVQQVQEAGKKVFVWTVNRSADMLRFRQQGVDGIISDNPALLVKTLNGSID